MVCTVAPLDTAATSAAAGYDPDYRTVRLVDGDGDGIGETARKDGDEFSFKAQIENDMEELQRLIKSGDLPNSAVGLVVHLRDMDRAGLITAARPLGVKKADRLVKQKDRTGAVVKTYDAPLMYCTHARHLDGYIGRRPNLALFVFGDRPQGAA
jgi:hypothetical protein